MRIRKLGRAAWWQRWLCGIGLHSFRKPHPGRTVFCRRRECNHWKRGKVKVK